MKEMIKKLQKRSNKKGFTLVEIIVVLVILTILAAIAVPAVLGYINDARDSKYIAEARSIYTVIQVEEAKIKADHEGESPAYTVKPTEYAGMNDTAETKTGLEDITITQATTGAGSSATAVDGKFNITWKSDGKTISATITKNKEVKINH